jgi:glyoxylase-like metal-dependent hydrolase (beta-lactamase superfamily II)/rhodanese-related sulfurtransferase
MTTPAERSHRPATAPLEEATVHVLIIDTASLGDRTHVVHDGAHAAVVDPQRDLDRLLPALDEHGLELVAVLETHVHNDYVSGGLELARRTGASYHLAADEHVAFDHVPTGDGTVIEVGTLRIRAVHTPGHTPTHLSYVVTDADGHDRAVLTGGGLLYGSVGRTDLIGPDRTEELTRAQHRSAHLLADSLADDVAVLPTHGFGSFCSSGDTTGADASTIGREREVNQALVETDEDAFVADLLAGLDAFPTYYAHMGPANRAGAGAVDLAPPTPVDATELARRVHAGEWVVDLRDRRAYASGHLVGTLNVELDASASTYIGWILPWDSDLTLIGASADDVAEMQRQLVRIGIDELAGAADAEDALRAGAPGTYPVTDFAGVAAALASAGADNTHRVVLDTRRRLEWEERHVDGAVHVPLHELLDRLDDVPAGQVLVHCESGYRASIAASVLARAGRDVVLVDDEFSANAATHLPVVG